MLLILRIINKFNYVQALPGKKKLRLNFYVSIILFFSLGQVVFGQNVTVAGTSYVDLEDAHDAEIIKIGGSPSSDGIFTIAGLTFTVINDFTPGRSFKWKIQGTSTNPVRITGDMSNLTFEKIYGPDISTSNGLYGTPALYLGGTGPSANLVGVDYVIVENLEFTGFPGTMAGQPSARVALTISSGSNNIIQNCKFSNFSGTQPEAAISLTGATNNNLIENCEFEDLNGRIFLHAIYLNGEATANTIRNNTVYDCSGTPFRVRDGSNGNVFERNTIHSTASYAFYEEWWDHTLSEARSVNNTIIDAISEKSSVTYVDLPLQPDNDRRGLHNDNYTMPIAIAKDDGTMSYWEDYLNSTFYTGLPYSKPFNQDCALHPHQSGSCSGNWNSYDTVLPGFKTHVVDFKDIVIGEDPAKFNLEYPLDLAPGRMGLWLGELSYDTSVYPLANFPITEDRVIAASGTEPKIGTYLKSVSFDIDGTDIQPRILSHLLYLLTATKDTVDSFYPERWVVHNGSGAQVYLIEGTGADVSIELSHLTEDYDVFMLWYNETTAPWRTADIIAKFSDADKGWQYFYDNAIYISSGNPTGPKARSTHISTSSDVFKRNLTNDKFYHVVVCPKNANSSSSFKLTARPSNSNATPDVLTSIQGPAAVDERESETWTAFASGGESPYTFEWRTRTNFSGPWGSVESTNQVFTTSSTVDFEIQLTIQSGSQSDDLVKYVSINGASKNSINISAIPKETYLKANYPNPFNPSTTIRFALAERANVNLAVYNSLGQKVRILVQENRDRGEYRVVWNGLDETGERVASGVYLLRLEAGNVIQTRKMLMIE